MKRITTQMAVLLFAFLGAPIAALADHHEGEKAKSNANSNAQWSEDAKKGQERAAEVKSGAKVDAEVKAGAKVETDAKANTAAGDASAKAKGKVDAAIPGMGAGAEVEAGATVK